MPEVIETVVYTYDELSPAAQQKALDWYRDLGPHHGWWDAVYDDFETICTCLGIRLKARQWDAKRALVCVWFSGFSSQGDGASFEGSWCYARGSSLAIRAHAPRDKTLHDIADRLQALQRRNIYQLVADIAQQGTYCHEYTMVITVARDGARGQPPTEDAETSSPRPCATSPAGSTGSSKPNTITSHRTRRSPSSSWPMSTHSP